MPSCSNIAINDTAAFASVHPDSERLRFDRAALRTGLARPARIDQLHSPTSVCSFAGDESDELIPCGVVDGLREHSGRESFHVQIFESDMRKTISQGPRQFVRKVAALAGNASAASLATRALALRCRLLCLLLRATVCRAFLSALAARPVNCGVGRASPVDSATSDVRPMSIPTGANSQLNRGSVRYDLSGSTQPTFQPCG